MFYKVTFCRDFLDFFALAFVAFTHISKVPSHRENFHNARSALQKNLARLAANQSAYYCSHIITADIKINPVKCVDRRIRYSSSSAQRPSFLSQKRTSAWSNDILFFFKKLKFNRSQVNSKSGGYRCFLLGTVSFRFALLSFGRI